MEKIEYTADKMENVRNKVRTMIGIVQELESEFPGRSFTLDGHLVGSIGEVMASYYYGIELYKASTEIHDGEIDGKKVQIKLTQGNNVALAEQPDYLIVLYLRKNGEIYEVYNGRGFRAWDIASMPSKRNVRSTTVNRLMEIDKGIPDDERIKAVNPIEKMKQEYKNPKKG